MISSSPLSKLFNAIASSPFRVAPEGVDTLQSKIEKRDITLEFTDKPMVYAEYVVSKALIRLGVPFLEALWAAGYVYNVTFHEYQASNRRGERYFSLGAIPRVANPYTQGFRNTLR
jgi:hypothetical protein